MENLNAFSSLGNIDTITYILKNIIIHICIYYTFLRILNIRNILKLNSSIVFFFTIVITILGALIKNVYSSFISIIGVIIMLSTIYSTSTKNKFGYSILVTIISFGINFIIHLISLVIDFIPNLIFSIQDKSINLIIIGIIHIVLLRRFFKTRKFKDGFIFLQKNSKNEYFDILILNISVIILFTFIILSNMNIEIRRTILPCFIAFSIIALITIQKIFAMYYKHNMLINELNNLRTEIQEKNKEIKKLEQENLNFSKISHSIAHKQKSLEHKLNELMLKNEIASEIDIKNRLHEITKELTSKATVPLSKTDIVEIDDMLKYMQAECINHKIEFELQISGNIHQMINNHIEKEDLEILLADHIKNAIIAINHSDNRNKSILVRLGIIDRCYSLYIYDSGIEFEIDTLEKIGKVPSTTHKESGGTGMGFMNTFDTLKKYKASMIISELGQPSKDNYTKVLMIKFDKKNEFKIKSYRSEEIENKCNSVDINVEKLIINKN